MQIESESTFACHIEAMNAEQRQRYSALTTQLRAAVKEIKELSDGYAFRFPSDAAIIKDAAEWISYERLCCPFFDFSLAVARDGGAVWLQLCGPQGVKPFIKSEFGI